MKKVMSTPHLSTLLGGQSSMQPPTKQHTQQPTPQNNPAKWNGTPPLPLRQEKADSEPKWALHLPMSSAEESHAGLWRGRWILERQTRESNHISGAFYSPRAGFQGAAESDSALAVVLIVPPLVSSNPQSCDAFAQSLAFSGFRVFVMGWTENAHSEMGAMSDAVRHLVVYAQIPHRPVFVVGLGLGALSAADSCRGLQPQAIKQNVLDASAKQPSRSRGSSIHWSDMGVRCGENGSHFESELGSVVPYDQTSRLAAEEDRTEMRGRRYREGQSRVFFRTGSYDGMTRPAEAGSQRRERKREAPIDGLVMLSPWLRLMIEQSQSQSIKRGPSFLHHEVQSPIHQIASIIGAGDPPVIDTKATLHIHDFVDSIRSQPHELSLPLLVIHGANDQLACPNATSNFFEACASSDKTLHTWPFVRHELFGRSDEVPDTNRHDATEAIVHCVTLWLFSQCRLFHQRQTLMTCRPDSPAEGPEPGTSLMRDEFCGL